MIRPTFGGLGGRPGHEQDARGRLAAHSRRGSARNGSLGGAPRELRRGHRRVRPGLRHVAWNPVLERWTGLTADEVVGRVATEVFPHLRDQGVIPLLERALAGETVTVVRHRVARRGPLDALADGDLRAASRRRRKGEGRRRRAARRHGAPAVRECAARRRPRAALPRRAVRGRRLPDSGRPVSLRQSQAR